MKTARPSHIVTVSPQILIMLTVQAMQYESLQERINEARRAKHDVRHHITLMQEFFANGNYDALGDCLSRYRRSLPDGALISY